MRRCYHLPTDVDVSGDLSGTDRERLAAAVTAAIALAVKAVALPGESVQPAVGRRPPARQRAGSAGQDVYVIPSYGGDKQVGVPAANDDDSILYPAPMPTTDIPLPPTDHPDVAVVGSDSPGFLAYVRTALEGGPVFSSLPLLLSPLNQSIDYWQVVLREPVLVVDRSVPFWGIDAVRRYAEVLAQGWHARDKTVDIAEKLRKLAKDFDETMQGSFARNPAFYDRNGNGVPLSGLNQRTYEMLTAERARLEKLPAARRLAGADRDTFVLEGLLTYRVKLQGLMDKHVVWAAWGWMRERRENLDFVTRPAVGAASIYPFGPTMPPGLVEADVVHAALGPKRELTPQEQDAALKQATRALQKKDPTAELSDEQKAAAIAGAEARKLGGSQAVAAAMRQAAIAAEQGDLVDVQEEDEDHTLVWGPAWGHRGKRDGKMQVLRRTAEFVNLLAEVYGRPFGASNYHDHGGGDFKNRGRSVDLTLPHQEASGFYPPAEAIRFAIAIDIAAGLLGMKWRVLYNDASVARAVNEYLGEVHMVEIANNFTGPKGEILNINWHGPLVTHFHLDLAY